MIPNRGDRVIYHDERFQGDQAAGTVTQIAAAFASHLIEFDDPARVRRIGRPPELWSWTWAAPDQLSLASD